MSVPTRLTALALVNPTPTVTAPPATATPTTPPPPATATSTMPPPATPTSLPEAKILLKDGVTRQRNGDYASAIHLYRTLLSSQGGEPEAQEALFRLGRAYLLKGDHQSAIEILQSFRRDYPESSYIPQAIFFLATAHKRQGDYRSALGYYREYAATGVCLQQKWDTLIPSRTDASRCRSTLPHSPKIPHPRR